MHEFIGASQITPLTDCWWWHAGARTPQNLPQKPSAVLARSVRRDSNGQSDGQSGSPGKKDSNSPPATQQSLGTSVTPVKRKLEEESGAETRTPPPSKERLLEVAP